MIQSATPLCTTRSLYCIDYSGGGESFSLKAVKRAEGAAEGCQTRGGVPGGSASPKDAFLQTLPPTPLAGNAIHAVFLALPHAPFAGAAVHPTGTLIVSDCYRIGFA